MDARDFALDGLRDLHAALAQWLEGLGDDDIMWQPRPGANHIAFILWHMLRVEDWFFQYLFQKVPQVWEAERWHQRMSLPEDPRFTGYGYTAEQVDGFPRVRLADLLAYGDAVRARTVAFIEGAEPVRFDEIVHSRLFGEVSIGHMVSHLITELGQHVGQIGYIRGLLKGFEP
ncbi:MAG: DinB family protein, partial [Chloroflexota bacterium]|nr:DinB family protein [Chloroflexota bacterium]